MTDSATPINPYESLLPHDRKNLNAELEHKHYPRDPQRDQLHTGRVRVQLVGEDGEFCCEAIHTRQQLYQMIAEIIPKLKTRQAGAGGGAEGKGAAGAGKKKKKKK
ncbi:Signal recognition particle 19 kDa protein [Geodia barretti]|uniref:Signal recognition particle 19 kDa protein n=1 Tax=Geodia barretti TaxID=519541 RepID=A0AA35SNU5_GEOBA|nr:Signal recognition particle 19 kDa protein [Geodia barretti]